ncbi:hypothetical protein [Uliginosibacterium sediminicola]|uniref:Uncharacterized protein n=1 Tax=Uliginosibacterium sediminicola TaxID=2024550 RepID=A0ABU9YVY9_9RHOO
MIKNAKNIIWVCGWFLAGTYFAVAAIGGSHTASAMALICGYIAGRTNTLLIHPDMRGRSLSAVPLDGIVRAHSTEIRKNMEYKFVSEGSGTKLEESVNELMATGWAPIGGVSVAVLRSTWKNDRNGHEESETEWVYAQAMTRTPRHRSQEQ